MTLEDISQHLDTKRLDLAARESRKHAVEEQIAQYTQQIDQSKAVLETLDKAVGLIGQYADAREKDVQAKIETLVTNGLRAVFNEDLRFIVQQKAVGKRTEIKFKIESFYDNVSVETDILSARGGGVAAVTGFLLRVIMILLTNSRRIIFLDETFSQVSTHYQENVAQLLEDLATDYGFQFILVTHRSPEIVERSSHVYETSMKNGKTQYSLM